MLSHVTGRWVKEPAEELEWSLTLGREDLSELPHYKKPARSGYAEGRSIYPPYPDIVGELRLAKHLLPIVQWLSAERSAKVELRHECRQLPKRTHAEY